MTKPQWRDIRKQKPDYGQLVVLKNPNDIGNACIAKYSPFRSSTTGRLVPVFVYLNGDCTVTGHLWYPIPDTWACYEQD